MRPSLLNARRVVMAEPGARRRVAANVGIIVVAVVLPSCAAVVLRPERPGEGYVFLAVGLLLIGWQVLLLRRSGVAVGPDGIGRRGVEPVQWSGVTELVWRSIRPPGPHGRHGGAHRLVVVRGVSGATAPTGDDAAAGAVVPLTRWPCTLPEARQLTTELRDLGLYVEPPVIS